MDANDDASSTADSQYVYEKRDEYDEREVRQRRVLRVEKTMPEFRSRISSSHFLQLPTEILADIMELLIVDKPTLANLALVNVQCRQLARTDQFCEVNLDYDDETIPFIKHLSDEGLARKVHKVDKPAPAIGTCIRHLTVNPHWLTKSDFRLWRSISYDEDSTSDDRFSDATYKGVRAAIHAIRDAITYDVGYTMPNLDSIAWQDRYVVRGDQLGAMLVSGCKHMHLSRVFVSSDIDMDDEPWPLRS